MTVNHSAMLEQGNDYHASAKQIPNGARLTVTAKNADDHSSVAADSRTRFRRQS